MSKLVKVTILKGLIGAGNAYSKGGTYEVSQEIAEDWQRAGYCEISRTRARKKKLTNDND